MNIRYYERKGTWWLDIRGPGVPNGRTRVSSGCPTESQARAASAALVSRVLNGPRAQTVEPRELIPDGPGVREVFELGLRTRERWITAKSKVTLEQTYRQLGLLDSFPVAGLTRAKVRLMREEWLQEDGKRIGSKLSASTINHRLSMLSVLLEVADLPPHTVKHLSTKGNRRTRRISASELEAMEAWCAGNAHRKGATDLADLIKVALDTAARLGELLDLSPADVRDGHATFRDTKNGETRTVPLRERSAAILGARRGLPGAFFPDLYADRVTVLWADMREALGLEEDAEFVFHTLRHEAISRLADEGHNAFTIQAIAGHANIATTQVYTKVSLGAMAAALGVQR